MEDRLIRGVIVGASSLLGKELAEELNTASGVAWELTLVEAEDADLTLTAAGDEAQLIQPISRDAFTSTDVVFFAGDGRTALEYWKVAHQAGAVVVDLTGGLEGQTNVQVRSPLVEGGRPPDIATVALVSAHPAAIMLAQPAVKLKPLAIRVMAATLLQPASVAGKAGMDELHQQTVGLLSFQPLKKTIYDAQVGFNLIASFGDKAEISLSTITSRIHSHVEAITGGLGKNALALQLIQAPVFHGYTASVYLEMEGEVGIDEIREVLTTGSSPLHQDELASNQIAAGTGEVLFAITMVDSNRKNGFWLWLAADNLRLAARNAASCAFELLRLQPINALQ